MSEELPISLEYHRGLERLYQYILENIDRDISSEKAAQAAGFSTFHFHRLFKTITNETLYTAIKRIRLENAAKLIVAGGNKISLTQIALDCGFNSASAFSRAFKDHFGESPSKWKKSRICKVPNSHFSYISPEASLSYTVSIETIQPIKVAYRSTLHGYNEECVKKSFWELYRWGDKNEVISPETQFIGIGLDDPSVTPEIRCRYINAVEVGDDLYNKGGEVSFMTIPGGRYAVLPFEGTRDEIPDAYRYLYAIWLPEKRFLPANSFAFEWYRKPPKEDGMLRFDIYFPLA